MLRKLDPKPSQRSRFLVLTKRSAGGLWGQEFININLVPRAHVSFGQYRDKELWNNQQSRSQSPRVNIGYVAVYMSSEDMIGLLKCSLIGRTPFVYANASH